MILVVGEILFDIFAEYRRLGGAPFNFAFHLKQLGIPVHFISRVGDDAEGREILGRMDQLGSLVNGIQIDKTHETGKVTVELNESGVPQYDIKKNAAYDFIKINHLKLSDLKKDVKLIYYGSLIQRTRHGYDMLQSLISEKELNAKRMYDINLRQGCYDKDIVINSLRHADLLKLNEEELAKIQEMTGLKTDKEATMARLMQQYSIEMVSLTKGAEGSELFYQNKDVAISPKGPHHIIDTVGAGDGYAAILAMGYLNKWTPEKILAIASDFAEKICTIEGAVPSDRRLYDEFRKRLNNE